MKFSKFKKKTNILKKNLYNLQVYKINKKQKKKINYNIIKTQKKNYIFLKINQIELNLKKIIKIVYKFNNLYLNFLFLNFNKCFFNLLKKIE